MINDIPLASRTSDFADVSAATAGLVLINWGDGGTRVMSRARDIRSF